MSSESTPSRARRDDHETWLRLRPTDSDHVETAPRRPTKEEWQRMLQLLRDMDELLRKKDEEIRLFRNKNLGNFFKQSKFVWN